MNSYDPVTGRPIFVDTDAPDIKVDPTEAARYAADVGNRIIRASLAELNAYAYKRPGLLGFAADTGAEYVYASAGWQSYGGRASARRTKPSSQTIANTTWTTVTWPVEADESVGMTYSAGAFTVSAPGRYTVVSQLAYDTPNTTGQRVIRLRRGSDVIAQSTQVIPNATYPALPQLTVTLTCNAGDVLYVETYQSSGANRTAGVASESSFISIDKVS